MSTHPNVILMAVLTPDDLPMKTKRAILAEQKFPDGMYHDERDVFVMTKEAVCDGGHPGDFRLDVMESDYDADGFQISAPKGCLVVHNFVTYGYGEVISWGALSKRRDALDAWCRDLAEKYHFSYEIQITANYW